jgi:hypothetical protein
MSSEIARTTKIATAGIAAAAFLFVQQAAADNNGITRFSVKNCTDTAVLICTYNKDDNTLAIPYDANLVKPGNKRRASCGSPNRCKAFSLISANDVDKVLSNPDTANKVVIGSGAGVGVGGTAIAWLIGVRTGAGAATAGIGAVAGAAIGVSSAVAVVKTINAVKAGNTCERALKDSRKMISDLPDADLREAARESLKRTLSGNWPGYKNYSFVTQDGVPALVEGDKC